MKPTLSKLLCLLFAVALALPAACVRDRREESKVLRWIERSDPRGPSTAAWAEDLAQFDRVAGFDKKSRGFDLIKKTLREGDLIAYRKTRQDARGDVLRGRLNSVGYGIFEYGHLGIMVKDPKHPGKLRIFSSQSFVGPNTREEADTLKDHDFNVYRLNQWERVDRTRFYEFIGIVEKRAGRWYGYDFSGMFGLWNSNLTPARPADVGHDYICSTVILAALYYSGVQLDAVRNQGYLDLCTPQQVVNSKGRFTTPPSVRLAVEDAQTSATVLLAR